MILLIQMTVLLIIMTVGFICNKIKLLDDASTKHISALVVNVANPCLVLSAAAADHSGSDKSKLLQVALIAVILYACLIFLAFVIPHLLKVEKPSVPTYRLMTIFSNIGFMGFPVIEAAYGKEALLYASIFLFPYNILIYTYGISQMTGESFVRGKIQWKKIFNIGVDAGIVALIIYIFNIPVHSVLVKTIDALSGLTAPLSMIVIGYSFAKMNLKELFTDVRMLVFSVIKLGLIPLAGVAILRLFGVGGDLLGVCFIMLATPVGSMTAMMAGWYGKNEELAARAVAITTLLSVATIPLMSMLLNV